MSNKNIETHQLVVTDLMVCGWASEAMFGVGIGGLGGLLSALEGGWCLDRVYNIRSI